MSWRANESVIPGIKASLPFMEFEYGFESKNLLSFLFLKTFAFTETLLDGKNLVLKFLEKLLSIRKMNNERNGSYFSVLFGLRFHKDL